MIIPPNFVTKTVEVGC